MDLVTMQEEETMTGQVFFDSTDVTKIPADARSVALYADGAYRPPVRLWRRFPRRRWITVDGNPVCGIADYEPGNPVWYQPGKLGTWARERHDMRRSTGIVYSDRADVREALAELGELRALWWIATLDGRDWTPEELSADLAENFGAEIPAAEIWGNQNMPMGDYDRSNLFGDWWA
jgi:hypothetical protein